MTEGVGTNGDTITGGAGNDTIYGMTGHDYLHGGQGKDVIFGGEGNDHLLGGTGEDVLTGGEGEDCVEGGDDRDIIHGGVGDRVDGGSGGDDWDTLVVDGDDVDHIEYTSEDQEDGIVHYNDGGTLHFKDIEKIVPCFTPGTRILTLRGEVAVESLQLGDKVVTRDNGAQEIRWIGEKNLSGKQAANQPHLHPILIRKGALGHNLPERDMMVSPNHRMLLANERTTLMFEEPEVLVAAKHLIDGKGVQKIASVNITYIHMMFDQHEVVLSDGSWSESFQPGDYSLRGIDQEQRNEIFELFPELSESQGLENYAGARRSLRAREAALLR